jgi:glycosyltransferase 2 family protein
MVYNTVEEIVMEKIFKSYAFNILLILVFTIAALYLTIRDFVDEILQALGSIHWGWLTVVIIMALFYHVLIGVILTQLTRMSNPQYKYRQGIVNALIAAFFHGITPSASGGQFAQVYVFNKQKVALSDAASVLWLDFIIYQSTMVFTVFLLMLFRFQYFFNTHSPLFIFVIFGFLINASIIFGLWSLARLPRFHHWVSTRGIEIGIKLRLIKNKEKSIAFMEDQIDRFQVEKAKIPLHKPLICKIICLNIVRLMLYYFLPYIAMRSLGISLLEGYTWLDVMALAAFVSMINAFIPIPGASGGTEATFILMFTTIIGYINASATMIIWRLSNFYLIMFIGGIVFVLYKFINRNK